MRHAALHIRQLLPKRIWVVVVRKHLVRKGNLLHLRALLSHLYLHLVRVVHGVPELVRSVT